MTDIVDAATRSRIMSGIGGKNTKPELLVRSLLHQRGFRFRLHRKDLPGKPDIVLSRHKAVIFVHGCFWHGHSCKYFRWPSSRPEFWKSKIELNQCKDETSISEILKMGWRVAVVWECSMRGKSLAEIDALGDTICAWLIGGAVTLVLPSDPQ